MESKRKLTYISNAGIFLELRDKKILVDPFSKTTRYFYKDLPSNFEEKIIYGFPPFNDINFLLISHYHEDHFNLESVLNFIKYHPETIIVSTGQVISLIRGIIGKSVKNLIEIKATFFDGKPVTAKDVNITCFSLIHTGESHKDVENLGFLIDYGIKILTLGDAVPKEENFKYYNFNKYNIDYLIANFPYAGIPSARQIVRNYINPKKIFIVHLPYQYADRFGWIRGTKKSYERAKKEFIEAEFLEELGKEYEL